MYSPPMQPTRPVPPALQADTGEALVFPGPLSSTDVIGKEDGGESKGGKIHVTTPSNSGSYKLAFLSSVK